MGNTFADGFLILLGAYFGVVLGFKYGAELLHSAYLFWQAGRQHRSEAKLRADLAEQRLDRPTEDVWYPRQP